MKRKYEEYKNKPFWKEICTSHRAMKARCYEKNNCKYPIYGGRGIIVCEEWKNTKNGLIAFYNWAMANGYQKGLTIDRVNVNGNYEPNNCRWANTFQQANNRSDNFKITYNGTTKTLHEYANEYNIPATTLRYRIKSGWNTLKALTTPPIIGRNQTFNNK